MFTLTHAESFRCEALLREISEVTQKLDGLSASFRCHCEDGECSVCGCLVRLSMDADQLAHNIINVMNAESDRLDRVA